MFKIIPLFLILMTTACATITSGTSQPITITSEPAQAVCQLERDGALVGAVSATPGTVTVSRSTKNLSVRCERSGYAAGLSAVPANFQAMTLGNLLVGGLIGVAVDAASGAMGEYPANVHVTLTAAQPGGGTNWYERRRQEIGTQSDERIAAVRAACTERRNANGAPTGCDRAVNAINAERENELRLLREQGVGAPQT